jgi:hypothetical protein
MPLYEITPGGLQPLVETSFAELGLREREDLQRLLREQPEVLGEAIGEDLMILAEEFSDWEDSNRRVDLLALDRSSNLVVIELKRTRDGGHMELQALRYAAMVSTLTFERAIGIHEGFLRQTGKPPESAREDILEFLGWDDPGDYQFAPDVHLVLVSGDFGKELTTTVLWLLDRGVNIRCVRLMAQIHGDRRFMDVRQVIPLPEAEDYQVRLRDKQEEERQEVSERDQTRLRFWTLLAQLCQQQGQRHGKRKPRAQGWFGCPSNRLHYNFVCEMHSVRVEIYIDLGEVETNKQIFDALHSNQVRIEATFGGPLVWERLDSKRASRIRFDMEIGGWRSPEDQWPAIHGTMLDAMTRLEKATLPFVEQIR